MPSEREIEAIEGRLAVFVHIRKTAGTTVRHIINRQYGRDTVRMVRNYFVEPDRSFEMVRALTTEPPPGLRAVHGHILFWPDFPWPPDTGFFTFLRDPVERTISHYAWLRARSPKFTATLEEALADGSIHDNLQTRVLAASMPFVATEETLEKALANIDRLAVVGLTERFDESVVLLTRAFGWRPMVYATRNVTAGRAKREELPPETVEAVLRYNALDLELYRRAQEQFEGAVAAQPDDFSIDVAALQRANRCVAEAPKGTDLSSLLPTADASDSASAAELREQLIDARAAVLLRDAELERLRVASPEPSAPVEAKTRTRPETKEEALAAATERARKRIEKAERKIRELLQGGAETHAAEVEGLRLDIARAQGRLQGFERRKAKLALRAPKAKRASPR